MVLLFTDKEALGNPTGIRETSRIAEKSRELHREYHEFYFVVCWVIKFHSFAGG